VNNFKFHIIKLLSVLTSGLLFSCTSHEPNSNVIHAISASTTYHVSKQGDDYNSGQKSAPFLTISKAAELAMPGDTIIVHKGIYRERIDPPRGGTSNINRITYQAEENQEVIILGSENVKGWTLFKDNVWKVTLDNRFFGDYNPYQTKISGDWFYDYGRNHHTGAVYVNGHWLWESPDLETILGEPVLAAKEIEKLKNQALWYAIVDKQKTTIYAQFKHIDPNEKGIEINTRESIFYPSKTGINFITVRGFKMKNSATNWAPPTAEQVAAIGSHWSKGWIIENNDISYARSACVSLGKYGDEFDNTSSDTAIGYVTTIERALKNGWHKDNIGQHVINNNKISFCEQAGIVGSMGAAFSKITNNTVHDIHRQKLFAGAEMAGIKFHAPIDTEISGNTIYNTTLGMWLDWMSQGTRVSKNVFYDNDQQDLWLEVNHGPALIDNNFFFSRIAINDWSEGNAFVHNLIAGKVNFHKVPTRRTPIHEPHSTVIKSIKGITGGDNRYLNNLFIRSDLSKYHADIKNYQANNVFIDSNIIFDKNAFEITLTKRQIDSITAQAVPFIDSDALGVTNVSKLPFVNNDGSKITINTDYFGVRRVIDKNLAGPFSKIEQTSLSLTSQ